MSHDTKIESYWYKGTVWTCWVVWVDAASGQTPSPCPRAGTQLSTSSTLSQGQVGVTGAVGPAGARGRFVSQLVSLLPFWLIMDLA